MKIIKEIAECFAAVVILFTSVVYYFTLYCFDKLRGKQ